MSTMQMMKTAVFDFGSDLFSPSAKPREKDLPYKMKHTLFYVRKHCLPETQALFRFNGKMMPTRNYTIKAPAVKKDIGELYSGDIVRWDEVNVPFALRQELGEGSLRVLKVTVSDHSAIAFIPTGKCTDTSAIPKTRYSPDDQKIELVVENMKSGKIFITPKHFVEKIR